MCEARGIRQPVMVVANRIDARAIAVSRFCDAVDRPRTLRTHRKAWGAISNHILASDVFQHRLGQLDIRQKLSLLLFGRATVREAVARQFVPRLRDAAYQRRISFGYPAEREE